MADDKGSDLDVFEGLTKKKKSPSSPDAPAPPAKTSSGPGKAAPPPSSTIRGGLGSAGLRGLPPAKPPPPKKKDLPPPSSSPQSAAPSKDLPPPSKASGEGAKEPPSAPLFNLPKPTPPPAKTPGSVPPPAPSPRAPMGVEAEIGIEAATAEVRRPSLEELDRISQRSGRKARESAPEMLIGDHLDSAPPSAAPSLLPGEASADLDWDDHEEATNVIDKKTADLFGLRPGKGLAPTRPQMPAIDGNSGGANLFGAQGKRPSIPPADGPGRFGPAADASGRGFDAAATPRFGAQADAAAHQRAAFDSMPRIPAPAPVPRDISDAAGYRPDPPAARGQAGSWSPSVPPPAPTTSSSRSTTLLVVLAAAVVAAAAFFYLRSSGPGTLNIRVEHDGKSVETAAVFIDGKQECTFTPCRVKNVDPGTREIRVAAPPLAGHATVEVKGGGEIDVKIPLGVSDETAPPAPAESQTAASTAPAKPASLSLKTPMTEKIKVFVDGADKGTLPVELKDLKAGKVQLRFETSGDKYGKLEKTVELKPGETFKLEDVKLPLKNVAVTFLLWTPGADVKLVQDQKAPAGLQFGPFTKLDKKLDTGSSWKVLATAKGFKDLELPIVFDDGKAEQTVNIKLEKAEEPTAAVPPEPVNSGGPAQPPPPPAAEQTGMINANSIPPSNVLIDGKPQGQTPVTGVKVAVGGHSVVFKHKDFGVQSRSVTVVAGKTATVAVKFDMNKGGDEPTDDPPKKKKKKKKVEDDE